MDITNLLIIIVGDYFLLNQNYRMLLTLLIPWVMSKMTALEMGSWSNYFYSNDKKYCMHLNDYLPANLTLFLQDYFYDNIHKECSNNTLLDAGSYKDFYTVIDKEYKILYKNKVIIVKKTKTDDSDKRNWYYKAWCCDIKILLDFIEYIKNYKRKNQDPIIKKTSISICYIDSTSHRILNEIYVPEILPKPILDTDIIKKLYNDIDRFLAAKQQYVDKQKTYKRAYLFEGLPGTGKTSLIKSIALKYKRNVFFVNLKHFTNIISLIDKMQTCCSYSTIIVFEDFACKEEPIYNEQGQQINTLRKDDLINLLEGMISPFNGQLIIMTTNYVENIDPVLIRPGRIDYRINFTYASREQIDMYLKQQSLEFPEKIINKYVGKATIAEIIYKIETNTFV